MQIFTDIRDGEIITIQVDCIQVGDRLNEDIVQEYIATQSVETHITALLAMQKEGYQVTLGGVDTSLNLTRELEADGVTIWKALLDLRDSVGGVIRVVCNPADPMTRELYLSETIGEDKGQQIRYRKNLKGIMRKVDYGTYASKLYPNGDGSLKLDDTLITDMPIKSTDASYGYLTLPYYSCYKNWTGAGNACPAEMILVDTNETPGYTQADSYSAPSWTNPANANDGNSSTFAYTTAAGYGYTGFYTYNLSLAHLSDKIRVYVDDPNYGMGYIDLDVYTGGGWMDVYEGGCYKNAWVELSFNQALITAFRVRLKDQVGASYLYLHEAQYYNINTELTAYWEQGEEEDVIRCDIGDYNAGANYELIYRHALYLRNVDASKVMSKQRTYTTTDIETLRGKAYVDMLDLATPYTTYEVSVVDLSQFNAFEFQQLGSLVSVIDEILGIEIATRIINIRRVYDKNQLDIQLSQQVKTLLDTVVDLVQ